MKRHCSGASDPRISRDGVQCLSTVSSNVAKRVAGAAWTDAPCVASSRPGLPPCQRCFFSLVTLLFASWGTPRKNCSMPASALITGIAQLLPSLRKPRKDLAAEFEQEHTFLRNTAKLGVRFNHHVRYDTYASPLINLSKEILPGLLDLRLAVR